MFRRHFYARRSYYPPAPPPPPPSYGGGYGSGYGGGYGSGGGYGAYPPISPMLPQERYNPAANLYGPMAIFRQYDRDGNGMITEDDFVIAMREQGMGFMGDMIARSAFRTLDTNRNGRLDYHEAMQAMNYLRR